MLIRLWLNHRFFLSKIFRTALLKNLQRLWYQNYKTFCLPAKPLTKRYRNRKKGSTTKHRLVGTYALKLSIWMQLTPLVESITAKIKRTYVKLSLILVTRGDILQRTIPNLEITEIPQKTSISFHYFYSDDWH